MALADSSENAILDLSKRVAKEDYCAFKNNTNVSSFMSNSNVKMFSLEHVKMFKIFPDKISEKEEAGSKNLIEAKTPSPDSPFITRTRNGTLQRSSASVSPSPGDGHPFASNSTTSALASNDQQLDRMWMRTLPHRKRPINLFKSVEESSGTDAKRVKTSFSDEACVFVPDKSDDQESLASSKSPEVFSPIDSPDKCDFIIKNHCNQILGDKSLLPPERIQTKSTSRTRSGQLKDEAYWERRRKNNEAAKRSRDTRKQKEEETAHKARSLAQENISLKAEINILRTQLCNMQSMLFYRSNTHSLL